MGLFKPDWQSNNKEKALRAVESETDQSKLAEIARTATLFSVRVAAVEKITVLSVLVNIVKNDKDPSMRMVAVKALINQPVLSDPVVTKDFLCILKELSNDESLDYHNIRNKASNKWREIINAQNNQEFLTDIAKNFDDKYVREAVVRKLLDQSVLIHIVKNEKENNVRKVAVENENLTDQLILAYAAQNESYDWVREAAIKKLTDQSVLANIAKYANNLHVRECAFNRLYAIGGSLQDNEIETLIADIVNYIKDNDYVEKSYFTMLEDTHFSRVKFGIEFREDSFKVEHIADDNYGVTTTRYTELYYKGALVDQYYH